MKEKSTIIVRLTTFVMFFLMAIPFGYVWSRLKNPSFYDSLRGIEFIWLALIIALLISMLVICTFKRSKTRNVIAIVLTSVYTIIYVCPLTFLAVTENMQLLFPIISKTYDITEYHNFDTFGCAENLLEIEAYFPERIPDNATNVYYEYYYNPSDLSMKIKLNFRVDFDTLHSLEKKTIDGWSILDNNSYHAYYDETGDLSYKHMVFFDSGEVEYVYLFLMHSNIATFGEISYCPDEDIPIN